MLTNQATLVIAFDAKPRVENPQAQLTEDVLHRYCPLIRRSDYPVSVSYSTKLHELRVA